MELRLLSRLAVAVATLGTLALVGCSKTEEPAPAPPAGNAPAAGTNAAQPGEPGQRSETPKIEGAGANASPE